MLADQSCQILKFKIERGQRIAHAFRQKIHGLAPAAFVRRHLHPVAQDALLVQRQRAKRTQPLPDRRDLHPG